MAESRRSAPFSPDLKALFVTRFADIAAVGKHQRERGMAVKTKPFPVVGVPWWLH